MNFFNRAIKNITRKLSKTVLLILTFFLIGNLVIIGLSVAKASDTAKTLARQKMRAVITYQIDYDKFYYDAEQIEDEDERNKFYENYPRIKLADVKEVLKDERVKTANAISNNTIYATEGGIDYVHLNNQAEQNIEEWGGQQCYFDGMTNEEVCESYAEPSFFVKGNYLPDMIELVEGKYKVEKGRFYNEEEIDKFAKVCLITEELAEANGVSVGDTIKLAYSNLDRWLKDTGVTQEDLNFELEVIGIYSHTDKITPDNSNYDYTYPYENPSNVILMPATTVYALSLPIQQKQWNYYKELYPDDPYYSNPEYYPSIENMINQDLYDVYILLNDPLEVDEFVEEYKNKAGDYKKLNANNDEFNRLAKPLDTLSSYAEFIVWLVVINAIVIITLVTALTLKTREYEIGVLLSIGASKFKVIAQFFIELAIVALLGFTLAVGSGSIISKKVGYTLLDNQIQSEGLGDKDEYEYGNDYISPWNTDYTSDISLEDIVAEYDVTVSPLIIGEIYVVGLGIVLISVFIPSIMIMRFNPKKILMNQY